MLHVQHLVVEDIFHDKLGNAGPIHASIQENLIGPGVVAAELAAPTASAPAYMRPFERILENIAD